MTQSAKSSTAKPSTAKAGASLTRSPAAGPRVAKPQPTKKALLLKRLQSRKGATLQQLSSEFGWQPHTVRAAISRLRTADFEVTRAEGKDASYYRIAARA